MMASTPPGVSRSRRLGNARSRPASSSFTAIRTAWKIRAKSGVRPEQRRQVDFVDGVEQLRRIDVGIGAHAHVERGTFTEGEAAGHVVELVRRHAEIEQDAVEVLHVGEAGLLERGVVAEQGAKLAGPFVRREALASRCKRPRIAVDARDANTTFQECGGVTTAPEGAVEHRRGAVEQRLDLGQQYGNMIDADASGLESTDRAHVQW
jgi:hypothetical protein